MTNQQILTLMESRCGSCMEPRDLRRIRQRFISREGVKASHYELVFQEEIGTREGGRSRPSRYRLTGLAPALGIQLAEGK